MRFSPLKNGEVVEQASVEQILDTAGVRAAAAGGHTARVPRDGVASCAGVARTAHNAKLTDDWVPR